MAVKVGEIEYTNTDGEVSYTGVGFQPKSLVLWSFYTTSHASITDNARLAIGFGADNGTITQSSVSAFSGDAAATGTAYRRTSTAIISVITLTSGTRFQASLVSMDADGFTLNWTDTTEPGSGYKIFYMALGGSDVTEASVVNWTVPEETGNQAVTGAGFQPTAVLHLMANTPSNPESATGAKLCIGAMTASAQWAAHYHTRNGTLSSNTQRYANTDRCVVSITDAQAVDISAAYISMDADGFTVNFGTVTGTAEQVISLCLDMPNAALGSFTKSADPAASQSVSGLGFAPASVLLVTDNHGTGATGGSNMSIGAASAAGGYGGAVHDVDASANMVCDSYSMGNACIADIDASNVNYVGDIDSLDSDGFTVGWPTNDASTDTIMYCVFGQVAAASALLMQQHHHGGGL